MTNPTLEAPALAPGVTLLGEYQGSGFTEPHYLIVRADQQVLHVSRLLFVVASHIDGRSPLEQVAARVSEEYGRTLDAEGVQFLVTAKLQPMGLVADAPDGDPSSFGLPAAPAALPVEPPNPAAPATVAPVSPVSPPPAPTTPETHPAAREPVAGTAVPWHPDPRAGGPLPRTAARPVLLRPRRRPRPARPRRRRRLVVPPGQPHRSRRLDPRRSSSAALRARHPAGRPRWSTSSATPPPAVTAGPRRARSAPASIRLPRLLHRRHPDVPPGPCRPAPHRPRRRLLQRAHDRRSDRPLRPDPFAGGALAIVFVHVEALQQLLPLGRLDGYFVVADLVGVPDLFGRIGPILRSAIPGQKTHPKVAELRRSARVVVDPLGRSSRVPSWWGSSPS